MKATNKRNSRDRSFTMKNRSILYATLSLCLIITLTSCSQGEDISRNDLDVSIEEDNISKVELLYSEPIIDDSLASSDYHENLLDLNIDEEVIYEKFKSSYDESILSEEDPITICKMYLFASLVEDYETSYALYTTNKKYVLCSKEEYKAMTKDNNIKDFEIFKDIYDLEIDINISDEERATISWFSKNGYVDEEQGTFKYSFSLIKDEKSWKVSFMPMQ